MERLFADMGYQGLASWLSAELGWTLLIVKRPRRWVRVPAAQPVPEMPAVFAGLPQRWIVNRCTMLPSWPLSGWCASSVQAVGGTLLRLVAVGTRVDLSRANQSRHGI